MTEPSYNVIAAAAGAGLPLNPGQKVTFVWESPEGAVLTLQQRPVNPPAPQPKWWQRWRWTPAHVGPDWSPLSAIRRVHVANVGEAWTRVDQCPQRDRFQYDEAITVVATVGFDDMTDNNGMIRANVTSGTVTAIIHDRQTEDAHPG